MHKPLLDLTPLFETIWIVAVLIFIVYFFARAVKDKIKKP